MSGIIDWFKSNPWNIANVIWAIFFIWWLVYWIRRQTGHIDRLPSGSKFRLWKRRDKVDKPR